MAINLRRKLYFGFQTDIYDEEITITKSGLEEIKFKSLEKLIERLERR